MEAFFTYGALSLVLGAVAGIVSGVLLNRRGSPHWYKIGNVLLVIAIMLVLVGTLLLVIGGSAEFFGSD